MKKDITKEQFVHAPEPASISAIRKPGNADDAQSAVLNSTDDDLHLFVRIVDLLSDYTVIGVLVGFTPGEVAILVDEPLSENREVVVHLEPFSFEGHTVRCRPSVNQYEAHISIDDIQGVGLRKTPRFPVMLPADLLLPNLEPVAITIRDLSREGMGIVSPISLKAGQPIAIASGPAFIFAVVRHCQPTPAGLFRAGVEMHHLFERPPQPESEHLQPNSHGNLWRRWTSRLFSRHALNGSGRQKNVRQLGVTEVGH